jgi:FtsP/CotA-like multicopper oxidase with cupredoxin domain
MRSRRLLVILASSILLTLASIRAGTRAQAPAADASQRDRCPRPPAGVLATPPTDLRSANGTLRVTLTITSAADPQGHTRYCYLDASGHQAPTLRVRPGDMLDVKLKNEISPPGTPASETSAGGRDPCAGGPMSAASTNLHFHGLALPPVCHQDETLKTLIEPGDPPFEYKVRIPTSQPPGLYWYHPHVHGFSEQHLLGGASGALVVEGIASATVRPENLAERILVIRDEWMPPISPEQVADRYRPTKQLSVNYVPVPYPSYPPARIEMRPHQRELWRVLNASADTYLDLYVEFAGQRQTLELVALDGVPLGFAEPRGHQKTSKVNSLLLPPAARAEFVVTAPAAGGSGRLMTGFVRRSTNDRDAVPQRAAGARALTRADQDDRDPPRPLASIAVTATAQGARPLAAVWAVKVARQPLITMRPARVRTLYFSERPSKAADPGSPNLFFITEAGHQPKVFDPDDEPTILVHQGEVEDWTLENRSPEAHTFHVHQLHFLVLDRQGAAQEEPSLRDTVTVPAWTFFQPFPSVTVRMDFRDPSVVGVFPFHCHIAQHLDGGMMGTIRVLPRRSSAH